MKIRHLSAFLVATACGLTACANIGNVGGGDRVEQAKISADTVKQVPLDSVAGPALAYAGNAPFAPERVPGRFVKVPTSVLKSDYLPTLQEAQRSLVMVQSNKTATTAPAAATASPTGGESLDGWASNGTPEGSTGAGASDRAAVPELFASSPDMLGVRIVTHDVKHPNRRNQFRVAWYDAKAKQPVVGVQLFKDAQSRDELVKAVQQAAGDNKISSEQIMTSIMFSRSGDLVIPLSRDAMLGENEQLPSVTVAKSALDSVLSEAGQKAQAAAMKPTLALDNKGAVPAQPVNMPQLPPPPVVNCALLPCVALTYDDGPGPYTPRLLQALRDNNAKATFFMIGKVAKSQNAIAKKVAEEGHQVGNHSWSHPVLTGLNNEKLTREIEDTNTLLRDTTGQKVQWMRPPYGSHGKGRAQPSTDAVINMPLALWDIDTNDWRDKDPDKVFNAAIAAKPGSIVLMHDIHPTTIEAAPRIIEYFKKKGWYMVTMDTLLADKSVEPLRAYRDRDTAPALQIKLPNADPAAQSPNAAAKPKP